MGREGLVSRSEAAKILGIKPATVHYLVRRGMLRPADPERSFGGEVFYDAEEVSALAEARERGTSLREVHLTATQAWATARVSQRRLDMLERLLGMGLPRLGTTPEDINALRQLAEDDMKQPINGADKVNFWADQLFSVSDYYLGLVADLGFDEPHEPYLSLSSHLLASRDFNSTDPAEPVAYQRLSAAHVQLRHSTFAYYVRTEGKRRASARFPSDFQGAHHDVMLLATAPRKK